MKKILIITICFLSLYGCQSVFGPGALKNTHPAYNQAIAQTLNEQMLFNLVRLKYRDQAYFLKINSVTAALTLNSSIGVGTTFDLAPGGNLIRPSLAFGYSDKPTISFQPLQGEDFLKSVMSSISLDALLVMTQSGWNLQRVFGLCVERINNIQNAPRASGPTPANEPEYKQFKNLLSLIRKLQIEGNLAFGSANNSGENQLIAEIKVTDSNQKTIQELLSILNLKQTNESSITIKLNNNFIQSSSNEISVRTRSISSILFYLSQNIEIPETHINAGLVTITKNQKNQNFNWSQTPAGSVFRIKSSETYPKNAFLAIPYRNYWFYLADNDLESKSTFMLLTQLFDLQAGQTKYSGPTLTLPVR